MLGSPPDPTKAPAPPSFFLKKKYQLKNVYLPKTDNHKPKTAPPGTVTIDVPTSAAFIKLGFGKQLHLENRFNKTQKQIGTVLIR